MNFQKAAVFSKIHKITHLHISINDLVSTAFAKEYKIYVFGTSCGFGNCRGSMFGT